MMILFIGIAFLLACFASSVMSYLSMATPVAPWIAPTLLLFLMVGERLWCVTRRSSQEVALLIASGSVGGILATAVGFSFPTFYFLDSDLFMAWVAQPYMFIAFLAVFLLVAGMGA
ncbi:MAG: hypothetical protein WBQ73_02970, partial [Candidatus Babeliales bacterium]